MRYMMALTLLLLAPASRNAVTDLQSKIDSGPVKLESDAKHGYLPALLKNFNIPLSSQTLVFGKNSFQLQLISPETPRAIYFNDDTYVSWTPGADDLEVATVDPKEGPVFYLLSQAKGKLPKFRSQGPEQCLVCHDF